MGVRNIIPLHVDNRRHGNTHSQNPLLGNTAFLDKPSHDCRNFMKISLRVFKRLADPLMLERLS